MSIYKRDGSQFYWYRFKYKNRWIQESAETANRRKAEKAQEDRRAQLRRIRLGLEDEKPKTPKAPMPAFAVYADTWLEVYCRVNCKEGTYRLNKQIIEDHLKPAFKRKKLDEIQRQDIEAFIAKHVVKKSKATVRNYVAVLRGILSKAVRDEIIPTNRASNLGRFQKETSGKSNAKKIDPLTPAEVQILLMAAEKKDFVVYAFFLTAVLTGMRISELIGLQWGDVDGVNRCIQIRRAVTHRRLETPKSHLQRRIDLADELGRALEKLRTYRKEQWLKKGKPMPEWVFCNEDGNFLNEFLFRMRKFYPLIKATKLRTFRIHDLRHTYAALMLQNGESPAYVKEQMGHHSIQITVDTYGHLIPGANRAATDRLSKAIFQKPAAEAASGG